jgi:hypothetical protein
MIAQSLYIGSSVNHALIEESCLWVADFPTSSSPNCHNGKKSADHLFAGLGSQGESGGGTMFLT